MTDLEEVQMLTLKLRRAFMEYAIKVLNGKRAPKPPNMQEDYDKLVAALHRLLGVKDNDNK